MGIETQDADFESGYGSTPTETPAAAKPDAEVANPEPAKVAPVAVDPIKDLAARFEKFEKGHTTLAGQFGRLQQSQKEIADQLAAAQAATKNVADAPTQAQVKDASTNPAEWEKLKAGYPEWAEATEKLLDARIPQAFDAKAFEENLKKEMKGETEAVRKEIIDSALDAVYPGWADEVKTPAFDAWLKAQSDEVKTLAASDRVGHAAKMLKLYEASKTAKPAPEPTPPAKQEPSPREKRLAAAVNPRGTGGHASGSTDQDEFEAGYNAG